MDLLSRKIPNLLSGEHFANWKITIFGTFPGLVNIQKAIEHGPVVVDVPIKNCDFP